MGALLRGGVDERRERILLLTLSRATERKEARGRPHRACALLSSGWHAAVTRQAHLPAERPADVGHVWRRLRRRPLSGDLSQPWRRSPEPAVRDDARRSDGAEHQCAREATR